MNNYYVYKHTSPTNKVYIGITRVKPIYRWRNGKGYEECPRMYRAIKKYGWDNFKHEILFENLTKEEAEQKEIDLIAFYNSTDERFGYNLAKGGNSTKGYKHTEETKLKYSLTHKGKHPWNYGKKGYSVPNAKGKKRSAEVRKKMSENRHKKAVAQYDLEGNLIAIYPSQIEAERQTGIANTNISMCCRGIYKQMNGYIWKRIEIQDEFSLF